MGRNCMLQFYLSIFNASVGLLTPRTKTNFSCSYDDKTYIEQHVVVGFYLSCMGGSCIQLLNLGSYRLTKFVLCFPVKIDYFDTQLFVSCI